MFGVLVSEFGVRHRVNGSGQDGHAVQARDVCVLLNASGREPVRDDESDACGCVYETHESDAYGVRVSDDCANDENGCGRHENARGRDDGHERDAVSDQGQSAGVDKIA